MKAMVTSKNRTLAFLFVLCMAVAMGLTATFATQSANATDIGTAAESAPPEPAAKQEISAFSEPTPIEITLDDTRNEADILATFPTVVIATVDGVADTEVSVSAWERVFPAEDIAFTTATQAEYFYAPILAEGCTLLDTAVLPNQKVQVGDALKHDPQSVNVNEEGAFTITGDASHYSYASGVLTITGDSALTIANTSQSIATSDRIVVQDGVAANITLAGINIAAPQATIAFEVQGSSTASIVLADNAENTVRGGDALPTGWDSNGNPGTHGMSGNIAFSGSGTIATTGGNGGDGHRAADSYSNKDGGNGGHGVNGNIAISESATVKIKGGTGGIGTSTSGLTGSKGNPGAAGSNINGALTMYGGNAELSGNANANIVLNSGVIKATGNIQHTLIASGGAVEVAGNVDGAITANGAAVKVSGNVGGAFVANSGIVEVSGDIAGAFSTAVDGDAVVFARSIADKSNQGAWSGIMFEDRAGKAYGSPTLKQNLVIPTNFTFEVMGSETFTVSNSAVITNNGTMLNNGTIVNNGTITNNNTVTNNSTITNNATIQNNLAIQGGTIDNSAGEIKNAGTITSAVLGNQPVSDAGFYMVTGGTLGTSYKLENGILTILEPGNYEITNKDYDVQSNHGIKIADGIIVDLTLGGVNVKTQANEVAAISVGKNATLNLTVNNENYVESGNWAAGIEVPGTSTLVITQESTGFLTAQGAMYSAGIGTTHNQSLGTIVINGGVIAARAGEKSGQSIGFGGRDNGFVIPEEAQIIINGGTVDAPSISKNFSTGVNGNAFIDANINYYEKTPEKRALWSGIVIDYVWKYPIYVPDGQVYGNPTLSTDATLHTGYLLSVPEGHTLVIAEGTTFTNNGAITNSGAIVILGAIDGSGTLQNIGAGKVFTGIEATPSATFVATGVDSVTLSGVTSGMKYKIDDGDWIDIATPTVNLTGISPCTIQIVTKGDGVDIADSLPQSISITQNDFDAFAIGQAKAVIEGATYTFDQAVANAEDAAKTEIASQINNLSEMGSTGITVTPDDIEVADFEAAKGETSAENDGKNGSFNFTVRLVKGDQNVTTASEAAAIVFTAFTGETDTEAVARAKSLIVDGVVQVAFGADQATKTAAVQSYVNSLLGDTGTEAVVGYSSGSVYAVAISKGFVNDSKNITMTIHESADPDIAIVTTAKNAAEHATYADPTDPADYASQQAINDYLQKLAEAAVNNPDVAVVVNEIRYAAPVVGTMNNIGGTQGIFEFRITVSKGIQEQATSVKSINIPTTAYVAPDNTETKDPVTSGEVSTMHSQNSTGLAKTGDGSPVAIVVCALALAAGGTIFARKKRRESVLS